MMHGIPDTLQVEIELSIHETVSRPDYFAPVDCGTRLLFFRADTGRQKHVEHAGVAMPHCSSRQTEG